MNIYRFKPYKHSINISSLNWDLYIYRPHPYDIILKPMDVATFCRLWGLQLDILSEMLLPNSSPVIYYIHGHIMLLLVSKKKKKKRRQWRKKKILDLVGRLENPGPPYIPLYRYSTPHYKKKMLSEEHRRAIGGGDIFIVSSSSSSKKIKKERKRKGASFISCPPQQFCRFS